MNVINYMGNRRPNVSWADDLDNIFSRVLRESCFGNCHPIQAGDDHDRNKHVAACRLSRYHTDTRTYDRPVAADSVPTSGM